MSNELTTTNLRAAFVDYAEEAATSGSGGVLQHVKFSGRTGDWTAGRESDSFVHEGDKFVVSVAGMMHGLIAWKEGDQETELLYEISIPFWQPLPKAADLPTIVGGKPQMQRTMIFRRHDDPADDRTFSFATSSVSGLSAIEGLCAKIAARIRMNPDEPAINPIIIVGSDSYMHKKKAYGRIYTPLFKIVGWTDADYAAAPAPRQKGVDLIDAKAERPADTDQAAPEPEPEPEAHATHAAPAETGPRRRRLNI